MTAIAVAGAFLALLFIFPDRALTASVYSILDDSTGGDCSSIGTWDPAIKKCTLNADLDLAAGDTGISMDADGITLDGAGHVISGNGAAAGVLLLGRTGATISNLAIEDCDYGLYAEGTQTSRVENVTFRNISSYGIQLNYSPNNTLSGNIILNDWLSVAQYYGIYVEDSSGTVLEDNSVSGSRAHGIYLFRSSGSTISGNNLFNNRYGLGVVTSASSVVTGNTMDGNYYNFLAYGNTAADYDMDIDTSNLADGRPIYYVKNASGQTFDASTNAAAFYCISCDNVIIRGLTPSNSYRGIFLWNTHDSTVVNVGASNVDEGVELIDSTGNHITSNEMINNAMGVHLVSSSGNTVENNYMHDGGYGIYLSSAANNVLTGNAILHSGGGISVWGSNGNTFSGNTVAEAYGSPYGIMLVQSNNLIYHNNFISNPIQAYVSSGASVFNLAAPTGGNYWSDWTSPDSDGDGFVDLPYTFQGGADQLPLVEPAGCAKPPLSLTTTNIYWESYADYLARQLSVDYHLDGSAGGITPSVEIIDSINTGGAATASSLPLQAKRTGYGIQQWDFTLKYSLPLDAITFKTRIYATATDVCGTIHEYPGPYPGS